MPKSEPRSPLPEVVVRIEAGDWPPAARLKALAGRAFAAAVPSLKARFAPGSEVSLLFTDDAHIRRLNRQYRSKDKPTNVLSFPGPSDGDVFGPLVGDLVLARETIAREAALEDTSFEDHLTHLIVHGFLHLLGYDHELEGEAVLMEGLETAILAGLGIADPYGGEAA